MEDYIVCNRIMTPDGTILDSRHRYDYKEHIDTNGHKYFVDGGLDYLRRGKSENAPDYRDLSVYLSEGHEKVREHFTWGRNYNENMELLPKTEYVSLKDITDSHLEALLPYTEKGYPKWINELFKKEKEWRENVL